MNLSPVTLKGAFVALEPLTMANLDELCEVGLDQELWKITMTLIRSREEMASYIATATGLQAEGKALPFAIRELRSGKAVGSTRLANIDAENRRVEIGWTWVARPSM